MEGLSKKKNDDGLAQGLKDTQVLTGFVIVGPFISWLSQLYGPTV